MPLIQEPFQLEHYQHCCAGTSPRRIQLILLPFSVHTPNRSKDVVPEDARCDFEWQEEEGGLRTAGKHVTQARDLQHPLLSAFLQRPYLPNYKMLILYSNSSHKLFKLYTTESRANELQSLLNALCDTGRKSNTLPVLSS